MIRKCGRPKKYFTKEEFKRRRREYRRIYNQTHKQISNYSKRGAGFTQIRENRITAINASGIMHTPPEKMEEIIRRIVRLEVALTV